MDLLDLQKPVEILLTQTNAFLKENVKSDLQVLNKISALTPITKGKKIRSTLLFLLAGANKCPSNRLPEIAAAIEMFHHSSLIHDDIMDNSELRRGEKTLNINLGNFQSVLLGDYLFITAFSSFHRLGYPELLEIVLNTARQMVEGQIVEVANSFNFTIDVETYFDIITRKTASLFAAVARIVALLCERTAPMADAFYQFGLDFGAIFQISDDMLDIFSHKSGKDRFRDMEEGKITLPFILLLKENPIHVSDYIKEGNREKLLTLFEEYHIKNRCLDKIAEYHTRCTDFLTPLPESVYKESLLKLLEFIKYREY